MIWFVLAMTLRRDLSYPKILNWMISSFRWLGCELPAKIFSEGALSAARRRLGTEIMVNLFNQLALLFLGVQPDFHGWVTFYFDGSTFNMPDTESNLNRFGKSSGGRGQSAFPMMRVVTLILGSSQTIIDMAFAPIKGKGSGERTLLQQIIQRMPVAQGLFLFDAGFYSYLLAHQLNDANHRFIMKVASSVKPKPFPDHHWKDGSYLAIIGGRVPDPLRSTEKRKAWFHREMLVRVIDVQVAGFRPFRLITNLMETEITAAEIVKHYHQRWQAELSYDEIKTNQAATLKGQAPTILRSRREDLVRQELYALLITYSLTRFLMKEAADEHQQEALSLSFLDSLQWIIDACSKMQRSTGKEFQKIFKYLKKMLAQSQIDRPNRGRTNPRVVKIKMSKYKKKSPDDKGQILDFNELTQLIPPPEIEELDEAA